MSTQEAARTRPGFPRAGPPGRVPVVGRTEGERRGPGQQCCGDDVGGVRGGDVEGPDLDQRKERRHGRDERGHPGETPVVAQQGEVGDRPQQRQDPPGDRDGTGEHAMAGEVPHEDVPLARAEGRRPCQRQDAVDQGGRGLEQDGEEREEADGRAEHGVPAGRAARAEPAAHGQCGDARHLAEGGPALVLDVRVDVPEIGLDHLLLALAPVIGGEQTQDGAVAGLEQGRHARPPASPRPVAALPGVRRPWAIRSFAALAPAASRSASASRAAVPASVRR